MRKELVRASRFLSLVLRHRPEMIGIHLDIEGWTAVEELLAACGRHARSIAAEHLHEVVETNEKQRFSFSPDGLRIRANQGHFVPVDLSPDVATANRVG